MVWWWWCDDDGVMMMVWRWWCDDDYGVMMMMVWWWCDGDGGCVVGDDDNEGIIETQDILSKTTYFTSVSNLMSWNNFIATSTAEDLTTKSTMMTTSKCMKLDSTFITDFALLIWHPIFLQVISSLRLLSNTKIFSLWYAYNKMNFQLNFVYNWHNSYNLESKKWKY